MKNCNLPLPELCAIVATAVVMVYAEIRLPQIRPAIGLVGVAIMALSCPIIWLQRIRRLNTRCMRVTSIMAFLFVVVGLAMALAAMPSA
jgi:hypothetical protein